MYTAFNLLLVAIFSSASGYAASDERIYQRVTGLEPLPQQMEKLPKEPEQLFARLFESPDFFNVRIATFVSRLSNEENEPFEDIDDFQQAVTLAVAGDIDFREIFVKPFAIREQGRIEFVSDIPERARLDFSIRRQDQLAPNVFNQGLFTTTGFARRFILGGTNRRPIRGIYDRFLCTKIEQWKDNSLTWDYIGKDIDRKPGDKFKKFEEECSSCHAPMDSQRGSFAGLDYKDNGGLRESIQALEKYNQNSQVYPDGFETIDDSWVNPLTTPAHADRYGWRGPTSGRGVMSYASMIVNSRQFQDCMTQRLMQEFCGLTEVQILERINIPGFRQLALSFRRDGYKIKTLIAKIVSDPLCD